MSSSKNLRSVSYTHLDVYKRQVVNHIPIIVVTAKVSEEERIKGIEAGADAYLTKPFNTTELRMQVEQLLDSRKTLRQRCV